VPLVELCISGGHIGNYSQPHTTSSGGSSTTRHYGAAGGVKVTRRPSSTGGALASFSRRGGGGSGGGGGGTKDDTKGVPYGLKQTLMRAMESLADNKTLRLLELEVAKGPCHTHIKNATHDMLTRGS
jgi:hypothetical protein